MTELIELIDTLWNVNIICDSAEPKTIKELIDTLWNVNNDVVYLVFCAKKRINRYIMECK